MLVGEVMTPNPLTTTAETPVPDALIMMRERKVRRLPVLDKAGKLVGIVSEKDLLYVAPSPATSLSIFEINSLIAKITVASSMTKKVITATEDMPIEEAARVMADNKIGGLPVLRNGRLEGIVTETDLFRVLLRLLGGRRAGVRVRVRVTGAKGTLARVASTVADAGGDIVGVGVNEASDAPKAPWNITLKVQDISKDALEAALRKAGYEILDIREMKGQI